MARFIHTNPQFLNQRANVLEAVRIKFNLQKLLDYGYSPVLYEKLNFPEIQVIEIDESVQEPNVITGDYLTNLPNHLTNDTCYTCFVFINPPPTSVATEEEFIAQYKQIKELLFTSNLKNSYLVLWVRQLGVSGYSVGTQEYYVFDLENKLEITSEFAGIV